MEHVAVERIERGIVDVGRKHAFPEMKLGEVGHRQHCWAAAWWSAEQRGLKPVIIPLWAKRPGRSPSASACEPYQEQIELFSNRTHTRIQALV